MSKRCNWLERQAIFLLLDIYMYVYISWNSVEIPVYFFKISIANCRKSRIGGFDMHYFFALLFVWGLSLVMRIE